MDWLQIASSLGLGGAVGAIVGVLAATQNAKQKFDELNGAVLRAAPEARLKIQGQFDEFRTAFDRLRGALDLLRRAMKRNT
jgi:hypothetical protein